MATNGRKRYFHLTKTLVESADEVDIDNLMSDCDTKVIAEEEITQTVSTQDASLATPVANLDVVPNDNQSENKEKNKKEELWKWTKKLKVTKQVTSCQKYNPIQMRQFLQ